MIRLTRQQILLLHDQLVAETGGEAALRDEGMLDSALHAPFQTFGGVVTLMGDKGAGDGNALLFFAYKIYGTAFIANEMGYACALAWFLFLIIGGLTLLAFKTNKWVYYEGGEGQ